VRAAPATVEAARPAVFLRQQMPNVATGAAGDNDDFIAHGAQIARARSPWLQRRGTPDSQEVFQESRRSVAGRERVMPAPVPRG
jgi:hypothetical protein